MKYAAHVEEVRLESEENGWELVVESEWGVDRFHVHGVIEQLVAVGKEAEAYLAEGRGLALEHQRDLDMREGELAADAEYERLVGDA